MLGFLHLENIANKKYQLLNSNGGGKMPNENIMGPTVPMSEIKKMLKRIQDAKTSDRDKKPDYALLRLLRAFRKSDDFRASSMTRGGRKHTSTR
jgi:hypothetical protein